jgi:hypothetical protein
MSFHHIVPDNDHRGSGRTKIFLRPSVNETKFLDGNRAAQKIAGYVTDDGDVSHFQPTLPLNAFDSFIGCHVQIRRVLVDLQGSGIGQGGVTAFGAIEDDIDPAELLRVGICFFRPGSRQRKVAELTSVQEVDRDHTELHRRAGTEILEGFRK